VTAEFWLLNDGNSVTYGVSCSLKLRALCTRTKAGVGRIVLRGCRKESVHGASTGGGGQSSAGVSSYQRNLLTDRDGQDS
jgi:hypothetical protein